MDPSAARAACGGDDPGGDGAVWLDTGKTNAPRGSPCGPPRVGRRRIRPSSAKAVHVQLRDAADPETGQRYTVKRYESEKTADGDSWRHEKITLQPVNPDFEPIVLNRADEDDEAFDIKAELVEVLGEAQTT